MSNKLDVHSICMFVISQVPRIKLNIASACLYFGLVIRQANRIFSAPYYFVICGLPGSTKFFPHYLIKDTIFEKLLNIK